MAAANTCIHYEIQTKDFLLDNKLNVQNKYSIRI